MGPANANIKAVITAKDEASGVLKSFGNTTTSVGQKVASIAKVAAIATAAAGAAAIAFGVASVKAYDDSENRLAQLNAVLKSTKGIAGVTSDSAIKLSKSLEHLTAYSDEEVLSAENLLLTFTAIGKDIFPQATKTVLDMATALGEDTKSASIQLGKALQDPVLGITALRRVGVNFNDAQKEVIKNLVDTGHKAEAQKLILKELNTEFGNSAEAARHTFGGSLKALKEQLNDVQEVIGGTIKNAIQPFVRAAADFIASVDWDKVIAKSKQSLQDLWKQLVNITNQVLAVANAIGTYLAPKLVALVHSIEQIMPTLIRLWKEVVQPLANVFGKILVFGIGLAVDALNLLLKTLRPVIDFMLNNKPVVVALTTAFAAFAAVLNFGRAVAAFQASMAAIRLSFATTLATVTSPIVLPALAIAAVLGSLALIVSKAIETKNVLKTVGDDTKKAQASIVSNADIISAYEAQYYTAKDSKVRNSAASKLHKLGAPGFAVGTDFAPGGMALVGEQGPELVNLPRGSQVIPNNKVTNSAPTVHVTFNGIFTGSKMDFRKLAVDLNSALTDAKGMGTI